METLENVRRYLFRDRKVMFEENVRTVAGAREVSSEGDQCELYLYQHRLPLTDSFTTFLFGFCAFSGLRKARFCIFYFKLNFLSTCLILLVKVSHRNLFVNSEMYSSKLLLLFEIFLLG